MDRTPSLWELELLVLLAVGRLADNAYRVPIVREIEAARKRYAPLGSVYAALERLKKKGLVSSALGEAKERGGGPSDIFESRPKASVPRAPRAHRS